MALETAKLDNGLNIYVDHIPGSRITTTNMFVPYGSVNEEVGDEGVAHAFEHCVHLQTDKFANQYELDSYDNLNGLECNADTYYTRTLYYANGIDLEPCLVHLSQILRHTHFPEDKVEHEMRAVRREAATRLDDVSDLHLIATERAMFGTPYGREVIGYHDRLDFNADKLKRLHERHYTLANMALVVAGAARLDEVAALANRYFEDDGDFPKPSEQELAVTLGEACLTGMVRPDSNNVRVAVGLPMTERFRQYYSDHRLASNVATELLSGKAFQALRYDKGISYDGCVEIDATNHPNAWYMRGSVTTDSENVGTATQVFDEVFQTTAEDYSDESIAGALATAKYHLCKEATSPEERAASHVSRLESYRQPVDVGKVMRQLKKLTVTDIRTAINDIAAFTASASKYTHLTGKRQDIGEVERVIDQSEIA